MNHDECFCPCCGITATTDPIELCDMCAEEMNERDIAMILYYLEVHMDLSEHLEDIWWLLASTRFTSPELSQQLANKTGITL